MGMQFVNLNAPGEPLVKSFEPQNFLLLNFYGKLQTKLPQISKFEYYYRLIVHHFLFSSFDSEIHYGITALYCVICF